MGHSSTKLDSKTGICSINQVSKIANSKHNVISIALEEQDELLDIKISSENVVVYNNKLYFFILGEKDKYDKSFLQPFLDIICDCKIGCQYLDETLKNSYKIFCLGLSHRLFCKYIAFCAFKTEKLYCIDSTKNMKNVGYIKVVCAFKPFSHDYFKGLVKPKGVSVKTFENDIRKKLNPSLGAFIMYKSLQYLYDVENVDIAILEATTLENINVYKRWGFKLGLGPAYNYTLDSDSEFYSKEEVESILAQHKKNVEKIKFKIMTALKPRRSELVSRLKFDEKVKQDCIDLHIPNKGYRMWIDCSPKGTEKLRKYIKSKFSVISILNNYHDAFDYNINLRQYTDSQINPSIY